MELLFFKIVFSAVFIGTGAAMFEPSCSKFDYEMRTLETMLRMEQKVEKMVEEMKVMKDSVITELEKSKAFRDVAKSELKGMVSSIDEQIFKKKSELDEKMALLSQKSEVALKKVDEARGRFDDLAIAFSVTAPTKSLVNGVPTFTEAITNIGGAYNVGTGVFTSPIDGLYFFSLTVGSSGKHNVYCRIQHNGDNKVLAQTFNDNSYTTAATSVTLLLAKDDTVTLGSCGGWTHFYISARGTSFSGFLIKQSTVI